MLQIKGQKWNTTQHSTLVQSVRKNGVRFSGMMIVMVTTMMMIDDAQKAVIFFTPLRPRQQYQQM
jgi:hypothetical protein